MSIENSPKIEQIELKYLSLKDFEALKEVFIEIYGDAPDAYWRKDELRGLIDVFPEGQVVILINGDLAGCAFSIIVDYGKLSDHHTYDDIAGDRKFKNHTEFGDMLYGIDVIIKKEYRGLKLGRRLYDYRKELTEQLNLKGIVFGGRIPNYYKVSHEITPKEYIQKVRTKEINDPV